MEKLIGREVTMVVDPGMLNVGCTTGDIIFAEPYVTRGENTNALFSMESTGRSGHKLYSLSAAELELVRDEPDGRFENVTCIASSEPGHCAGVAAALRKLADRLDSLELANNMPTTLNA